MPHYTQKKMLMIDGDIAPVLSEALGDYREKLNHFVVADEHVPHSKRVPPELRELWRRQCDALLSLERDLAEIMRECAIDAMYPTTSVPPDDVIAMPAGEEPTKGRRKKSKNTDYGT